MTALSIMAQQWAYKALSIEFGDEVAPATLWALAEALIAITEHYNVPDELLVEWIRDEDRGGAVTGTAWREWCEEFAKLRAKAANGT
jgi:hypothetical protein